MLPKNMAISRQDYSEYPTYTNGQKNTRNGRPVYLSKHPSAISTPEPCHNSQFLLLSGDSANKIVNLEPSKTKKGKSDFLDSDPVLNVYFFQRCRKTATCCVNTSPFMNQPKNVAILGATGSVGQNALAVIEAMQGYSAFAISGHSNLSLLSESAQQFSPRHVAISDSDATTQSDFDFGDSTVNYGPEALDEIATLAEVDVVIAAIVGCAGLASTWAAVNAGKTVALANKEALVVAGSVIMPLAKQSGAMVLPVDSEHSAIFQAARAGFKPEISRVILTASGGPLRDLSVEQMQNVTVEQALAHPTWDMGPKITVDSATMMNKALEIIEARWLFDLRPEQISVVIHPQSIIHSMVEFVDGSVIAQMSPPDMKLPIQYALTYPERIAGPAERIDFTTAMSFDLIPADLEKFPALKLGFEVAETGGTSGAVLNAANEVAVNAFLNGEIAITDIAKHCRQILDKHTFLADPTLQQLMAADAWARQETSKWKTA